MNIRKKFKDKFKTDIYTNTEENNDILKNVNVFILDIVSIPFTFENNNHIINDIFNKYDKEIYIHFKKYYREFGKPLVYKGILNCAFSSKEQRNNSFLENYNRRIKSELYKLIQ